MFYKNIFPKVYNLIHDCINYIFGLRFINILKLNIIFSSPTTTDSMSTTVWNLQLYKMIKIYSSFWRKYINTPNYKEGLYLKLNNFLRLLIFKIKNRNVELVFLNQFIQVLMNGFSAIARIFLGWQSFSLNRYQ